MANQPVERVRRSDNRGLMVSDCRPLVLLPTLSGIGRRIAHLFRSATWTLEITVGHNVKESMRNKRDTLTAILGLLTIASPGLFADTWNIAAGYSGASNPNGPWSYGRKWTTEGTAMDLFTWHPWEPFEGWGLDFSGPAIRLGPVMWVNNAGKGFPCYRWTCPESGTYNIRGEFNSVDLRGWLNFVFVVRNGSIVFSNVITSYYVPVGFTNDNVRLNQGDVVDFTIKRGGGVSPETYYWTSVSGDITQVLEPPRLDIRVSQVELCWRTATNTWYQLQYRSTLTTNAWVPLDGTWVAGTGATYCTNDAVLIGQPQRFYQFVVTNAPPSQ